MENYLKSKSKSKLKLIHGSFRNQNEDFFGRNVKFVDYEFG